MSSYLSQWHLYMKLCNRTSKLMETKALEIYLFTKEAYANQ